MRLTIKTAIGVLLLSAATPAFAADVLIESPAPSFSWSGFYVGGHLGYGFGETDAVFSSPNEPGFAATQDYDIDGFLGGVQLGYNHQFDSIVVGAEADFSWSGIDGESDAVNEGDDDFYDTDVDWFGTLRARLGYALDRTMIYGTGGLAYGRVENRYANPPGELYSENSTNVGWTAGAGVEHAFTDRWTAKIEYLYIDLEDQTLVYDLGGYTVFDNDFHTVRLGINYRF